MKLIETSVKNYVGDILALFRTEDTLAQQALAEIWGNGVFMEALYQLWSRGELSTEEGRLMEIIYVGPQSLLEISRQSGMSLYNVKNVVRSIWGKLQTTFF